MGKTISKSVWARLMQENFIKPINYPELKRWERPVLWKALKEKQITKEIAEDNVQKELTREELFDEVSSHHFYINTQLWYNLCELGWLHRDNGETRDIEIWTRKMARSLWDDYNPWLGAVWRILDNFTADEIDFSMLEESFEIVTSLQGSEPGITAGTIYSKLYEQMDDHEKAREYRNYINAIFAGWEEFNQPTFVTQRIQDILNAREKFCPKCNRRLEDDAETCEHCGSGLELGNRYVCFACKKYVSDEFSYCPYCGTKINRYPNVPENKDTIEFALQKFTFGPDREPSDTAAIYVNGESFRKIIWKAETQIAEEQGSVAGGYAWLAVWELLDELTQEQDINSEEYLEPKIFGCTCGYSDCNPLHVKITETEDTVTWSGFYNPFNSDLEMTDKPWDYSKIRAYHFDKRQYYAEIEKLQKWYDERHKKENKESAEAETDNANLCNKALVDLEALNKTGDEYYAKKEYDAAFKYYKDAAEQGYAIAQNHLGSMFMEGCGVEKDDAEAAKWFRKAAEKGYAAAQNNLGLMYNAGRGVKKNNVVAATWYRKAAEQGDSCGQYDLGLMYLYGEGVTKDYVEAAKLFQKAAEQGLSDAQYNLALLYRDGEGVPQDYSEAAKLFQKAAEQGMEQAQLLLGAIYRDGQGVTQDYNEAMKWFQKAAENGNGNAFANIGLMYAHGDGVEKNLTVAKEYYDKAIAKGSYIGQIFLNALDKEKNS